MIHLYKNFLTDKRVYCLNEAYYTRLFKTLTNATPTAYYTVHFNNGEKFYDGNPIFSVLSKDRVLKIIQEAPDSETPFIYAWMGSPADSDKKELTISLELSKETQITLQQLIQKWIVERVQITDMEQYLKSVFNTL